MQMQYYEDFSHGQEQFMPYGYEMSQSQQYDMMMSMPQPWAPPAPSLMSPSASAFPELAAFGTMPAVMPLDPMMGGGAMHPAMMAAQQAKPSRSQWDDFHRRRNATVKKQGFTTKESAKHQFQQQNGAAIQSQAANAYLQSIGAVPQQMPMAQAMPMMQADHLGFGGLAADPFAQQYLQPQVAIDNQLPSLSYTSYASFPPSPPPFSPSHPYAF